MTTTLAFLGDFGDAIEYIFSSRETREGTTVGGTQFLELTWEHLKLTLRRDGDRVRRLDPARSLARAHPPRRLPRDQPVQRRAGGAEPRADRVLRRLPRRGLRQPHARAAAAGGAADPHEHLRRRHPGGPRHRRRRARAGHDRAGDRAQGGAAAGAAAHLRRDQDVGGERGGHRHDRAARRREHAGRPDHQRVRLRRHRPPRGRDRGRHPGNLHGVVPQRDPARRDP